MTTDFVVGGPARGDDFCFRAAFLDDLWEALRKDNVLLLAPRRMGKTSVMYQLLDDPREGYLPVHLNVEALRSPAEFFIHLIEALHDHQPSFVRDYLGKSWAFLGGVLSHVAEIEAFEFKLVLKQANDWQETWQDRAAEFFALIENGDQKVLFIIDELPDMLIRMRDHDEAELETFLHCFRDIRMRAGSRMRWLVGGSVNIRGTLDQKGRLKLINDLKTEILPPFTADEVEQFVRRLLDDRGVRYNVAVVAEIHRLLGRPVPLFLQLLTQELYRHWKRHPRVALTVETVRHVFEKSLLGEVARDKLQHFHSRIDAYYPEREKDAAYLILDRLSVAAAGLSRSSLLTQYRIAEDSRAAGRTGSELDRAFDRLMGMLQSDFYVDETEDGRIDFASRLLKMWWRKYYGSVDGDE